MSQIGDRRHRNDLDLFVLALLESGITTPYELQHEAGLSPGATLPVLRRLAAQQLAVAGKAGLRGRQEYRPTAAGLRYLREGWRPLLAAGPSGDLDADLRVALLALVVGADRASATEFLRHSAVYIRDAARSMERAGDDTAGAELALRYRQLRTTTAQALLEGEATAALKMARMLASLSQAGAAAKRRAKRK